MSTDEPVQNEVVRAFENMSDDEAAAWVAARDFTSVAGIPLTEEVSRQFAELLPSDEVTGFGLEADPFAFGQIGLSDGGTQGYLVGVYRSCASGQHFKEGTITVRKAGG